MSSLEVERRQNENDYEYHKRLVNGKLVDKTLADMDYSELAKLVYGQHYSSDVARRMMYGSRRTIELQDKYAEKNIKASSVISEIENKKMELKAEQKKMQDQRRELNKIIFKNGRSEHLEECLINAANNLNESFGKLYDANEEHWRYCIGNDSAVLVLSDWHYGMITDNIWNTYNKEIFKDRLKCIAEKAAERMQFHHCGHLDVVVLGDLINGAIHTSARVASEELVCDQIMEVAEALAQTIEYLSDYVEEINVYMTYGNHARTVQRKEDNIHRDNLERIIPWWMEQRLQDEDRINIISESDYELTYFEARGKSFVAAHGDLDAVKTSPKMLATLFQKKFGKNIDYILLGDKHHRESFEELGISAMICGSLCGTDEYANNKRLYSTPSQLLLILPNSEDVDVAEYNLKCS